MSESATTTQSEHGAFADQMQSEVDAACSYGSESLTRREGLTQVIAGYLEDAGILDGVTLCDYSVKGIEVAAAFIEDEGEAVDLCATIPTGEVPPRAVGKVEIDAVIRRLREFARRSLDGFFEALPSSSPARDVARRIGELQTEVGKFRFFIFTDGRFTTDQIPEIDVAGIPAVIQLWDAPRLERITLSGRAHEPISVDFEQWAGAAIPCLSIPGAAGEEYTSYLLVLNANLLANLYQEYGPRLMELNVRSFLQARGKINRGIRDTLRNEPDRFLAYNNGISATAEDVILTGLADGREAVRRVNDFQIVNGGQTTASLYWARRRDGVDLGGVWVQAKLTAVRRENILQIVPLISRYSNSQNAVSAADFEANGELHISLEKLSRNMWAPPAAGSQQQTTWFYERARGQYAVALSEAKTRAQIAQFRRQHPSTQKIEKVDLARFENIWALLPQVVSLGNQKNFREYMIRIGSAATQPVDASFFRMMVAKAIVVGKTDKIVAGLRLGAYKANTVAYTLAFILNRIASPLDLERIWRQQRAGAGLERAITMVAPAIHTALTQTAGSRNVTEWCKKDACWDALQRLPLRLPEALDDELIVAATAKPKRPGIAVTHPMANIDVELIRAVRRVTPDAWKTLAQWCESHPTMKGQANAARAIARELGGSRVDIHVAERAWDTLKEAIEAGFSFDGHRPAPHPAPLGAPPPERPDGAAQDLSPSQIVVRLGNILAGLGERVMNAEPDSAEFHEASAEQARLIAQMNKMDSSDVLRDWSNSP